MKFTKIDLRFFNIAHNLAINSDHYKTKVGAVLVDQKQIVSADFNSNNKSHPLQKYYNENYRGFNDDVCRHLIHAELSCIIKCKNIHEYSDLKIYIVRVININIMVDSRPCKACIQALQDYKIYDIYYSTISGFAYERLNC
jgi:deoxycytidylate deaminase